jgi:hypothetical protein
MRRKKDSRPSFSSGSAPPTPIVYFAKLADASG